MDEVRWGGRGEDEVVDAGGACAAGRVSAAGECGGGWLGLSWTSA